MISVVKKPNDGLMHAGDKLSHGFYLGMLAVGSKSLRITIPVRTGTDVTGIKLGMAQIVYNGTNIAPKANYSSTQVAAEDMPAVQTFSVDNDRSCIYVVLSSTTWYNRNSSTVAPNGLPAIVELYNAELT